MDRRLLVAGFVVVLLLAVAGPLSATLTDSNEPELKTPPLDAASASVAHFLQAYVEPDGRTVRKDKGGDTLAEGQADAMLLTVATGDRSRFDAIWNWAQVNLKQSNGLLASRWTNGQVAEVGPAPDADIDAARALALAARKFNEQRYADEAKALATAVMGNEVMTLSSGGKALLVKDAKGQLTFDSGSYSPRSLNEIALLTGNQVTADQEWKSLTNNQSKIVETLMGSDSKKLPADVTWVDSSGVAIKGAQLDSNPQSQYYFVQSQRLSIRLGESCDAVDQKRLLKIWSLLGRSRDLKMATSVSVEGSVKNKEPSAVAAVAAAAGAKASQDSLQTYGYLDAADEIESTKSSFDSAVWAALGRVMLTTPWLGSC